VDTLTSILGSCKDTQNVTRPVPDHVNLEIYYNQNTRRIFRSPFSSVVERATRNGEVGCSIQPVGTFLLQNTKRILINKRVRLPINFSWKHYVRGANKQVSSKRRVISSIPTVPYR
jgi:hypothetical protein